MIETPAAAVISDRLVPMVVFFSVGTNGLTRYTHKNGAWIGICGELAAGTSLTKNFIRMGIDELLVSPAFVLRVRDAVRNINLSE